MPSNQTPNYALSQWERDDRVLMEDFNADNAKIDAALATQAALLAGLEARKGNCRIEFRSYVGTGQYGPDYPTVITFSRKPLFVLIFGDNQCMLDSPILSRYVLLANDKEQNIRNHFSIWTDSQLAFYSNSTGSAVYHPDNPLQQMNQSGMPYCAVLFFAEEE